MKEAYWGYWLIALGVFVIIVMMLVSNVSATNTQDYYIIKEISEAAMVDAVDYGYYRESGELRINKEKYVENFLRRFAENVSLSVYQIDFYGIYESPPKASVQVTTKSNTYQLNSGAETFDIVNRVDAMLELDNDGSSNSNNVSSTPTNPPAENNKPTTPTETPKPTTPSKPVETPKPTTPSKPVETPKPTTPSKPVETPKKDNTGANDTQCTKSITSKALKGMKGTAMVSTKFYHTLTNAKKNKSSTGNAKPGTVFEILGSNGDYWAILYKKECAWIKDDYMAINLKDYIPQMEYKITNASGSIYKSSGKNIPNLTGKKLYSDKYESFVPATYGFAVKLKKAADAAKKAGDTLVVYDAYRPKSVSTKATNELNKLYQKDATVRANINKNGWGTSWFLAQGLSAHNTGCAVDITLKGAKMPSNMHELSTKAVKFNRPIKLRPSTISSHEYYYSSNMTKDAKTLDKYMTGAGLNDLASEWWHFQLDSCHDAIKKATGGMGANFWSNV